MTNTSNTPQRTKPEGWIEPGWHQDLSNDFYHRVSFGYSSSFLKKMLEHSPAKVLYDKLHPQTPSESMRLGTAVHSLVMEPEKFESENLIIRSRHWSAVNEAVAAHPDKNVISEANYDAANRMADNVLAHPNLKLWFEDGIAESSVYQWYNGIDPEDTTEYREMIKVRPDFIPRGYPVLIDLKSARDASFTGFHDAIIKYHYNLSAAMYKFTANGCQELLDYQNVMAFTNFVFVVVENTPPYQCAWYELHPDDIAHGLTLCEQAMTRINRAKKANWPPYVEECRIIKLAPYSRNLKII